MVINAESAPTVTGENLDPNPDEDPASQHSKPLIRLCRVDKNEFGSCGFHLTRTKWDPYPWIAGVDENSPAQAAGFKVGDCVLEVNGEDVLGLKIGEIANKVQVSAEFVSMLLWNAGSDPKCDSESLCCTPMPTSLSRLSSCLSSILSFLECPVCFEIISPPAHQCPFGHIICFHCRVSIERCPVCRTNYTRERSLLADKIYNSIIEAFHLKKHSTTERTAKLWERIFGRNKRRERNSHSASSTPKMSRAKGDLKNRFITRLIGKATSVDNLSSESNFTQALRKKSISSTDVYPVELLKRSPSNNLNQSYPCSSESLMTIDNDNTNNRGNSNLTRYLSANLCDALARRTGTGADAGSLPYGVVRNYRGNRLQDKEKENVAGVENLFQFSCDRAAATAVTVNRYCCPLSETCEPIASAISLLTHLQQHDGPIIQFFRSRLIINFPFSFENNSTIIIVHCHENTFFLRLLPDEVSNNIALRVCVWLLGPQYEADKFRLKVNIYDATADADDSSFRSRCGGNFEFTTTVLSLGLHQSTKQANDSEIYKHRFIIADSTLRTSFQDRRYALHLHFERIEVT